MKDSEEIAAFVLGVKRHELHLGGLSFTSEDTARINGLMQKRSSGYPLQYILGEAQFLDCIIKLREGVFIPRPETEILVDALIGQFNGSPKLGLPYANPFGILQGLELGTGSGCIAIGLTKYLKNCTITASDISSVSIDIASKNAALNGVEDRIKFILSDMFDFLGSFSDRKVDFIVSNPPYIKTTDLKALPVELSYEPIQALGGGEDGLLYIKKIIEAAPRAINQGGLLALEIGDEQRKEVERFAGGSGRFSRIEFLKDLNGIDRVFIAWTK